MVSGFSKLGGSISRGPYSRPYNILGSHTAPPVYEGKIYTRSCCPLFSWSLLLSKIDGVGDMDPQRGYMFELSSWPLLDVLAGYYKLETGYVCLIRDPELRYLKQDLTRIPKVPPPQKHKLLSMRKQLPGVLAWAAERLDISTRSP